MVEFPVGELHESVVERVAEITLAAELWCVETVRY